MNIKPINPGEFLVIPKQHIDHFTDLPDQLSAHIMVVAQKLARNLMREFRPARIGYVVHGFGVPHAHLNVIPLHHSSDIISSKHIILDQGSFHISEEKLETPSRSELNKIAARLRSLD